MTSFLRRNSVTLLALLAAAYSALWIWGGSREGFTHDDLMNLNWAIAQPWRKLLLDCALIWQPAQSVRPLGEAAYRVLWQLFHFDPFPFRVVCLALIAVNTALCFLLARFLIGNTLWALVVAWFLAYHGSFWGMYCNTGVIFDILAVTCYSLALLAALWKPRTLPANCSRLLLILLLAAAALNSKEIAVSLPAALGVLLLLEHRSDAPGVDPGSRRLWWNLSSLLLVAGVTALFVFGRVLARGGIEGVPGYHLTLSAAQFATNWSGFLSALLYDKVAWTPPAAVGVLVAALAVLAALRWFRELLLFLLAVVSFLPMAFILPRGLDASFLSVFWLMVAVGCAFSRLPLSAPWLQPLPFALILAVTASQATVGRISFPQFQEESRAIRLTYSGIRAATGEVRDRSALAFVEDPFAPRFPWATTFMVLLARQKEGLSIVRPEDIAARRSDVPPGQAYDLVLLVTKSYDVLRCTGPEGRPLTMEDLFAKSYVCPAAAPPSKRAF